MRFKQTENYFKWRKFQNSRAISSIRNAGCGKLEQNKNAVTEEECISVYINV